MSLCVLLTVAFGHSARADVQIFAAASLRGGLEAALADAAPDARVSYGGSGAIARQVALGAPADLVVLANPAWDRWLASRSDLPDEPVILLENRLVLVGKGQPFAERPSTKALKARLGKGRLAMGQRDAVPAGQYARAWLEHIGAWSTLAGQLAEAGNVRAALAYVARSEAPLGLVYATDAQAAPNVSVLWRIDPETHPPILYVARALNANGIRLLSALQSPSAKAAFQEYGFLLPAKALP